MPASCYTKALREPVFFLWELRSAKTKLAAAKYRSKAAIGMIAGNGDLVYDHAVPFCYLQRELLNIEQVTIEAVRLVLEKYGIACLITKEENRKLNKNGLNRKMPSGWDGVDSLARYKFLNIEVVENASAITITGNVEGPLITPLAAV